MAGIYLHIPFCKRACHYCNFHFSTNQKGKEALLLAMVQELEWQKTYLQGQTIESIYFGGGTPSLLSTKEINVFLDTIYRLHSVDAQAEITLEANPDDLTKENVLALKADTSINRLSIGIQSFSDEDLQWMNRAHNAKEALECLDIVQNAGFNNLTVDLIYGSPGTSHEQWLHNLQIVATRQIPHISCYCLTVEENTALGKWVKRGQQAPPDEAKASAQFEMLMEFSDAKGFEHYEISNFALPGYRARHNSNYWLGRHYLGIGPSAHTYNGLSRQWNIANNALYVKSIEAGTIPYEKEILSKEQAYNEYVMTSLRTIWGCSLEKIEAIDPRFKTWFLKELAALPPNDWIIQSGDRIQLSRNGKFFADHIASELFITG